MNKKKGLIIAIIVLLVGACGYFLISKNNNTPANDCVDCVIEPSTNTTSVKKAKNFNIVYSGETKKYNAYDFIIEKLGQAQYWTYEQYEPIYNTVANHYSPSKEHVINNATGWILYDEDTASFARGYEGRLIINFADNTAISHTSFYNFDYDNSSFSLSNEPLQNSFTFYDFVSGNEYKMLEDGTKYDERTSIAEYDMLWDEYNEINRTLIFYEKIFNELGISILNMPKGTLASYKNKTINVPIELINLKYWDREQDNLIHSPFDERVGWTWHWEDEENIWLDDYRDVFNQQFPNSTDKELEEVIDLDGSIITENTYAPVFLCLTNTKWSDIYEQEEGLTGTEFYNFAGAFETYYLKPLYKEIFGFNGVYFYDEEKMPMFKDGDDFYGIGFRTLDYFNNKFYLDNNIVGEIVYIYDKGDVPIGANEQLAIPIGGFDNVVASMKMIKDHYNIQSQFGEDYPTQLSLLYNINEQLSLGLR